MTMNMIAEDVSTVLRGENYVGCVIPRLAPSCCGGEFTQPSFHLLAEYCTGQGWDLGNMSGPKYFVSFYVTNMDIECVVQSPPSPWIPTVGNCLSNLRATENCTEPARSCANISPKIGIQGLRSERT